MGFYLKSCYYVYAGAVRVGVGAVALFLPGGVLSDACRGGPAADVNALRLSRPNQATDRSIDSHRLGLVCTEREAYLLYHNITTQIRMQ